MLDNVLYCLTVGVIRFQAQEHFAGQGTHLGGRPAPVGVLLRHSSSNKLHAWRWRHPRGHLPPSQLHETETPVVWPY